MYLSKIGQIPLPFFMGIILAVLGSSLVIMYKPKPHTGPEQTQTGIATETIAKE